MQRFLTWLTDPSLADSIAGDLAEERRRRARRSPIAARVWHWRTALAIGIWLAVRRLSGSLMPFVTRGFGFGKLPGEFKHGVRALRRTPWYSGTVIAVITLTMALAATTFAVVDGVLFRPLPYKNASELYIPSGYSYALSLQDARGFSTAVPDARVALYQNSFGMGFIGETAPVVVRAAGIGRDFFEVLGVQPDVGGFRPEDFEPSTAGTPVLISHRFWVQYFGSAADVVGKRLPVGGAVNHSASRLPALTVAGVLRADFVYPSNRSAPDVLLPIAVATKDEGSRNASAASLLVRVPTGVSIVAAESRVTAAAVSLGLMEQSQDLKESGLRAPTSVTLRPLSQILVLFQHSDLRTAFIVAAALVLLACVNIAGLTMARARDRQRQIALRQALGATGWDLLRVAIAEAAPLLVVGTLLGLWLAPLLLTLVVRLIPASFSLLVAPSIDGRVVAFSAAACVLATAIIALTQRRIAAADLSQAIGRGQSLTAPRGRVGFVVVTLQVAMSFVLAIGATLVIGSLYLVWQQDPGVDLDRVAFVEVDLTATPAAERDTRMQELQAIAQRVPGVEAVGAVNQWFLRESGGWPAPTLRWPDGSSRGGEYLLSYSGPFFEIFGIHAKEGRLPSKAENEATEPLLVVSERAAREMWPNASAIGQSVIRASGASMGTVVGVVPDARLEGLDRRASGFIYQPTKTTTQPALIVRTETPSATLARVVALLKSGDRPVPVLRALTLADAFANAIRLRTFRAWLFGSFAIAALAIVGVGILGLVAMSTARRTREMGIRYALGANRQSLISMLLREQMLAVGAGVVIGGATAYWAVKFVKTYMFQFTVYDSRLWAIAVAVLVATAVVGTLVPALRASRTDPIRALRVE